MFVRRGSRGALRLIVYILFKGEFCLLEDAKLFHKAFIWVGGFSLSFDELKGVSQLHREEAHDKHDDAGGGARHSHCAMDQALGFEIWIILVDLSEKLLNPDVLLLLFASLYLSLPSLEVDIQYLVRDGHIYSRSQAGSRMLNTIRFARSLMVSVRLVVGVQGAIMNIWHRRLLDESENLLEDVKELLFFLVVEAHV